MSLEQQLREAFPAGNAMIKFNIYQNVIDRMYYATLLGG